MRLGFHYHCCAVRDGAGMLMNGAHGRFVDSLARYCESVVCFLHSPAEHERVEMDYLVNARNVSLVSIGLHTTVPRRLLGARTSTLSLREHRKELDVLLIRGPSPLLPAMARAAGSLPVALLLVGDYLTGIDELPQPRWRKEVIRAYAWWNARAQLRIAQCSLTFVNSRKLYEDLSPYVPNLFETRTTTLTADDFFEREDTCQTRPYHLLYTGRIDRAKGLRETVEALSVLVGEGEDVVLDLVGWLVEGDTVLEDLMEFARAHNMGERVRYHGSKPLGPELFAYYRGADVFVIASYAEGFPRAIWEAMAHSLPVVASSVGSIPAFCSDAAVLVPRMDVRAILVALRRVLHDAGLRRQLIAKGRILAQQNTLDMRAKELVGAITEWLRGRER